MAFLTRYVDDDTRPTIGEALRDVAVRALLPAIEASPQSRASRRYLCSLLQIVSLRLLKS